MASVNKKVLVPIAHGTEPMEAVIMVDILRISGAEVIFASVEKQLRIGAAKSIKLFADVLISECSDSNFDLIALPGGRLGVPRLRDCAILEMMVRKQADKRGLYAAVCAAPAVVLGSWGLLKGLIATCFPIRMPELASSGVAAAVETRVQKDGIVVTSRGPGTTMEFTLALVDQLYGEERADRVSRSLVMRTNHGAKYSVKKLNLINWTFDGKPKVLVPVANGTDGMEAVTVIDVLRRGRLDVVAATLEDTLEVLTSHKVKLEADMFLDDAAKLSYDLIVLPGGIGGAEAFAKSEKLVSMLRRQKESNRPYGAIGASPPLVLEPHGLLKGKKATAFPALCDKLSDRSEIENRVVVDGNLITSRGPGTSTEFALAIVEIFYGHDAAHFLATSMIFVDEQQPIPSSL